MQNTTTRLYKASIVAVMFLAAVTVQAQKIKGAKTFAGPGASIGWTTTTISWGITAEHILFSKGSAELAIKGNYNFPHRFGNLVLFFGPSYSFTTTEAGLGLEGYFYPGKEGGTSGFFFSAGAGAWYSSWKFENHGGVKDYIRPSGGVGIGAKWILNDRMAVRWSNNLKLAGPNPDNDGAEVITSTTLTFGF